MARFASLVLLLGTCVAGCASTTPSTPDHDSGVDSATPLMCTCPCDPNPFPAPPTADACWVVSCEPLCGPGSGNAC